LPYIAVRLFLELDSVIAMNDKPTPHASGAQAKLVPMHVPRLFWLSILGLAVVTIAGTTWAASAILAKKGSEKILRVDLLLPKLKSSHGERKVDAFRMSEPESSELAHPKERKVPLPPIGVPTAIDHPLVKTEVPPMPVSLPVSTQEPPRAPPLEPGLNLIKPIDLTPPPLVDACGDPVIYQQPCAPQRGDSPMMRNWKTLTMFSLLSVATYSYVPTPIYAGDKVQGKIEGIEELQNSIKELTKSVRALENKKLSAADLTTIAETVRSEIKKLEDGMLTDLKRDVAGVKTDVGGLQSEQSKLKAELEGQKLLIKILGDDIVSLNKKLQTSGAPQTPAVDKTFMEQLNTSIKMLNDTIAKLGPTEKRTSMSMPNGTASNMGRVVLVNLYSQDLLFTVNGMDLRVPARTTKTVENIPVGTLRYSVFSDRWGILQSQSTSLAANDTFTLTASNP